MTNQTIAILSYDDFKQKAIGNTIYIGEYCYMFDETHVLEIPTSRMKLPENSLEKSPVTLIQPQSPSVTLIQPQSLPATLIQPQKQTMQFASSFEQQRYNELRSIVGKVPRYKKECTTHEQDELRKLHNRLKSRTSYNDKKAIASSTSIPYRPPISSPVSLVSSSVNPPPACPVSILQVEPKIERPVVRLDLLSQSELWQSCVFAPPSIAPTSNANIIDQLSSQVSTPISSTPGLILEIVDDESDGNIPINMQLLS